MTRRALAVGAALFALALAAQVPLRVALGWAGRGLSARAVTGTVWSGRISGLRVGPLSLGTFDARLHPLPLLLGRAELRLERPAASQAPFSALVSGSGGDIALRHVEGTLPLGGLGALPATSADFSGFAVTMRDGACAEAEGTLVLHLVSPIPAMPGGIALSGTARCQDGALVVPMQDPGGMAKLRLEVRGSGAWTADLIIAGLPAEAAAPLRGMGFSPRPQGLGLKAAGKL